MLRIFLTIVLFVTVAPVLAVEIAISSGDWRPIKIAVEHFLGEERLPAEGFSDIIISNLSRSGTFLAYADAVIVTFSAVQSALNGFIRRAARD